MPVLDSIVVSIPACHAGDQGSIPCRGAIFSGARKANTTTSLIRQERSTCGCDLILVALGFLHSRTNLSPFTKDFRGGDHLDEYLTIFRGLALTRPFCRKKIHPLTIIDFVVLM